MAKLLNVALIHLEDGNLNAATKTLARALAHLESYGHTSGILGARCLQIHVAVQLDSPNWSGLIASIRAARSEGCVLLYDARDALEKALLYALEHGKTQKAHDLQALLRADIAETRDLRNLQDVPPGSDVTTYVPTATITQVPE